MANKKKTNKIKKIVLAAGESKRFGNKNKLSQIINYKPIINHVLHTLLEIFDYSELIVIIGHEHKLIKNFENSSLVNGLILLSSLYFLFL